MQERCVFTTPIAALVRRVDRGEKMFGRGEKDALLHQAGGIADAGYVATAGLDGKIVQIGTTKDDARVGRGRKESNMAKNSGVKADAFGRNFMLNRRLKHWDRNRIAPFAPYFVRLFGVCFQLLTGVVRPTAHRGVVKTQRSCL